MRDAPPQQTRPRFVELALLAFDEALEEGARQRLRVRYVFHPDDAVAAELLWWLG